ncbi:4-hydroxy-tetrahydrodipicolinate reductase [Candidatus Sumerlaeota bacterium]|nr:4-hydroxy-tetrahydrodipicolinate reductase [Candidatus Sumerlaeota bacterium]
MKLALIGYGRMGRALHETAMQTGHEIVALIDPAPNAGAMFKSIEAEAVAEADVCLEFTAPQSAAENLLRLIELGKPTVCGSTGWHSRQDEVHEAVKKNNGALLCAANFSIGVNLFYRIVEHAAGLFDKFADYEPYVLEHHHSGKADAPSGTALQLAEIVRGAIDRKTALALERLDRKLKPEEISVAAVRAGGQPGLHTVGFDGPLDGITLTHANRDRVSLAHGALLAAEWLQGRKGCFEFNDAIDEILNSARG